MKSKSHLIAELLIDATENVLMKSVEDWMNKKHPNKKLTYKIGSGKRTYHRKISDNKSIIVYGKKMIESKLSSYKNCSNWLTSKEIISRNYFNKEITIQNVLCAVIMHETAHYFQVIAGYRDIGSVHNEHFYRILDKMYASGATQKVYDYLNKHQLFRNLEFEKKYENLEELNIIIFSKNDIKEGNVISFKSIDGSIIKSIVIKANLKKIKCVNYTVPYSIVTQVEEYKPNTEHDLLKKPPIYNSKNIKKGDLIYFKNRNGEIINDTVMSVTLKLVKCMRYAVPYHLITNKC